MTITVMIPAKNEEELITSTLKDLAKKLKIPHKIIVVNDYSSDKTSDKVKQYARIHPHVRVVNTTPKNNGFSNALKLGISKAKSEIIVIVMADLCDDPRTINQMYQEIQNGWDIVCGSRYVKGGKKSGGPRIQGLLSKLVSLSLYYLTNIQTRDVSNAFKMYRKSILKGVIFNPLSGVEASMEIMLQAYFNGAKIKDVPTSWRGRTVGKSKFKIFSRAPKYFKIYLWALENYLRKSMRLKLKKFYVT